MPFRSVNRRGDPGHDFGLQRHHLLPRQILGEKCFGALIDYVGRERIGFDDFRINGLLLPATGEAAARMQLPLHRGPHRSYNSMVLERLGQIEPAWASQRLRAPEIATDHAMMRMELLQRALRKRLLAADKPRLRLNRMDPLGSRQDYTDLDGMAEALWSGTALASIAPEKVPESV